MPNEPGETQSGRMTWVQATTGTLAGTTCLWQDLDGLHVQPPPDQPPPTSILWAWDDTRSLRVRLDGATALVAVRSRDHDAGGGEQAVPLPWSAEDRRVFQAAPAGEGTRQQLLARRWTQILDDGLDTGAGPITFLRPAPPQ